LCGLSRASGLTGTTLLLEFLKLIGDVLGQGLGSLDACLSNG
jgi:hypothetical protein